MNNRNFLNSLKRNFKIVLFLCTAFVVVRKSDRYIWIFHWVERLSCLLQQSELGSLCWREYNNKHDRFPVSGKTLLKGRIAPITVGHIPRELSPHTLYAIKEGAQLEATVHNTKARPSPLVQSGLEISVRVKVV